MKTYNSVGVCDECSNHTNTFIFEFEYSTVELCKKCCSELTKVIEQLKD